MILKEQTIKGVYLVEPEPFEDERGVFRRHFCQREFEKAGLSSRVSQCNVSENFKIGTLRGFHYQESPHGEGKTLSCLKGKMYDVVVDLRENSSTYGRWESFLITSENRKSVHVPSGCANAFMTMENDTLIHYYCSEFYQKGAEKGIRYDDPSFQFMWPFEPECISEKDKSWPDFKKSVIEYSREPL